MKTTAALSLLALLASAPACTKEAGGAEKPAAKAEDCSNCPDAAMVSATPAASPEGLVKGITLTEFTPISRILASPEQFEGKRVLVKGEAVAVCATRGCWVTLKSDADLTKALRVKVEDGEIVFPMTVKGKEVQAEGIVEKVVTPEDKYRELLQKRAESKGETFDPKSVTGPLITWQLRGLGAKFES